VAPKAKNGKNRKAATYMAELMLESLQQFPEKEQDERLKDIHRILKNSRAKTGTLSRRSSRLQNPRESQRASKRR
jgi:hypothetical protein